MNLDEFKSRWNSSLSIDNKLGTQSKELDVLLLNTFERVNQLARTSKFWWILSAIGIGLVFTLLLITAILYMRSPEQLESLKNAISALILLPTFVTAVGLLYYKQARIFDVHNCHSLSKALHQSIIRFRNWYWLSLIAFTILLSPVYYLLIAGVLFKFNYDLSTTYHIALSGILTMLTLFFNHLQYKRTYFHWIGQLKKNMEELAD
jgi:magnesium-transporting ATPase (P-type)